MRVHKIRRERMFEENYAKIVNHYYVELQNSNIVKIEKSWLYISLYKEIPTQVGVQ